MCFPTETVYALAADATNYSAVKSLYHVKGRPFNKKIALFVSNIKAVTALAITNAKQLEFLENFIPGPLTFILPKKPIIELPFQTEKIAIRIPDHKLAQHILNEVPFPIAATSANFSSEKECSQARDLNPLLLKKIKFMYKDDRKVSGEVSTIIDISTPNLKIIRNGSINERILQQKWLHILERNLYYIN